MAFRHGVYKQEVPTSLLAPVRTESGLPVIVGTAPIHLASDEEAMTNVNKPQLIYSYSEAVSMFGFSRDWEKYTLCEFIYSQFALFAVSPCVLINVLDLAKHKETVSPSEFTITDGEADLGQDVILANGVTFSGTTAYTAGVDYSLGYDDDADNEDVPYESPSNKSLQMNACVTSDGKEVALGLEEANYLNGQGIVTALNWTGGWRAWGNRTAAYPSTTDVKDMFIPVRRMFDWIGNEFILTMWQKTDAPMTPRLIRTIVNSYNVRLNGLAAREFILGGRIEFLTTENPTTDLLDGILRFHLYISPPPPAEQIWAILEYDPSYFSVLFDAVA